MPNIDFESLTKAELLEYAKEELGLDLSTKLTKTEIVQSMREITGSMNQPAGAASASQGNEGKVPKSVIIEVSPDENTENFVKVNCGGKRYQIMKGKAVRVPYVVYDTLKNAIEGVPIRVKNKETGKFETEMRDRQRHPFSVVEFIYE